MGQVGWQNLTTSCGVPQGSVLRPLLWNIAYDWVLRGEMPSGENILCYADDTLVLVQAQNVDVAVRTATAAVSD